MQKPFACIFDMNGVIVDDIPYHILAWRKYFELRGRTLSDEEFTTKINGRTTPDICSYLFGRPATAAEAEQLEAEKEGLYRELYRPHRKLVPGVRDFLESLRESGIPTAVATSAPPVNISPFILEDLGVREFFAAVIDANQVTKGKPDPEIYLKAASSLGMDPKRCVVFEDSKLGIQAATNAGMTVVGILTTHPDGGLPPTAATAKDFRALTVSGVGKLLEQLD